MPIAFITSESYLGSTLLQYLVFFLILAIGAMAGRSLSYLYRRRFKQRAETTDTKLDDVVLYALGRPVVLLGVVIAIAFGREVLTPEEPLESILGVAVEIPVIIVLAWIAIRLTDGIIETYMVKYASRTESKLDDELVPIVSRITNIAIASIAGVVILDSIGYDVTAIIASLGIGGIAIAFAARRTLTDIFGGAHILSTKPFLVGDTIEVDGTAGTVEEIGLRTTRIRAYDGREVMIPNSTIANTEVTNVTSEPARRVRSHLVLRYETSAADLTRAKELAVGATDDIEGIDPDRSDGLIWEYGPAGIDVRLQYFVDPGFDWQSAKDAVNMRIRESFEEAGLVFAEPTVGITDR